VNIFNKLQNIDRRVIYAILLVVLVIPLLRPIGIPLSVNETTKTIYNIIEDLDPATDVVLLSFDYSPGGSPDVHPQAVVIAEHLMRRGIKWVGVSFWDAGPMYAEQIMKYYEAQGAMYGVDFVNLGYMAGGETAIKNFGDNPRGAFSNDFRGNSIDSLPVMAGINNITDFAYTIDFVSGNPGFQEWVRQVQGPHGIKYGVGIVTVSVPQVMPFLQAGQVQGLLQGLRGAAEYEMLLGSPGAGAAKMDAQSMGHMVIILFILVGNVAFFMDKKKDKK